MKSPGMAAGVKTAKAVRGFGQAELNGPKGKLGQGQSQHNISGRDDRCPRHQANRQFQGQVSLHIGEKQSPEDNRRSCMSARGGTTMIIAVQTGF